MFKFRNSSTHSRSAYLNTFVSPIASLAFRFVKTGAEDALNTRTDIFSDLPFRTLDEEGHFDPSNGVRTPECTGWLCSSGALSQTGEELKSVFSCLR